MFFLAFLFIPFNLFIFWFFWHDFPTLSSFLVLGGGLFAWVAPMSLLYFVGKIYRKNSFWFRIFGEVSGFARTLYWGCALCAIGLGTFFIGILIKVAPILTTSKIFVR